jgi:hypothetical protein
MQYKCEYADELGRGPDMRRNNDRPAVAGKAYVEARKPVSSLAGSPKLAALDKMVFWRTRAPLP